MATPPKPSAAKAKIPAKPGAASSKGSRQAANKGSNQPPGQPDKKRRIRWALGGLVLVCLLFYYFTHRNGEIAGNIHDSSNSSPLKNVSIQLDQQEPVVMSELTEAFGINPVKPGEHSLTVTSPGYLPQTLKFTLGAGENKKFDLAMQPVPVADRLTGRLALVGTREPNSVVVYNQAMEQLFKVPLESWPADAVADGETVYVLESSLDRISIIGMHDKNVVKAIPLPKLSGPVKMLLSSDHKQLLVLNAVAQNLTVIDTRTYAIVRTIPLPAPAIDMALSANGMSVFAGGQTSLWKINYSSGYVDAPLECTIDQDGGLKALPGTDRLLLPFANGLELLDPNTEKSEGFGLGQAVKRLVVVNNDRLLIASNNKVFEYSLAQHQIVGTSFDFKEGEARALLHFGNKWLFATHAPDTIYLLDENDLSKSQQMDPHNQIQFMVEDTL